MNSAARDSILSPEARQAAANQSKLALDFAVAALRAGDVGKAEQLLRQRLFEDSSDANALIKLGEIISGQGRTDEAILIYRRTLRVAPQTHQVRLALAQSLQGLGEFDEALKQLEALPESIQMNFTIRAMKAALLGLLGRHSAEILLYEQLLDEQPNHPSMFMSYGNALKYAGRSEEAVAALRKAIKANTAYGEAWWSLANIKTATFEPRDVAAMRKALKGKINQTDALHLLFALGKAFEDQGDYEQSFRHYDMGNRLRSSNLRPEQMSVTPFVDAVIASYTKELFERHAESGHPSHEPIFIVGLQRSGSTLIEQILASHSEIEGTAELLAMQQLWDRLVRSVEAKGRNIFQEIAALDASSFAEIGAEYLERTRPFRMTDKPYFVDKLPANWMHVGFIRLVLPNAKIIDARRHPMACGFSNFKQHYATGVTFSYSQESIGIFYRDYWRLMSHFDRVQPGAIHRVTNERLIEDPESEVRRMLDFIGLAFEPACLEFHSNRRAVRTASAEQVRRPINSDGIDYWRHYEQWLGPMKQAMGEALNGWDARSGE